MASKNKQQDKRLAKLESQARPEVKYVTDESSGFDAIGSLSGTLLKPQEMAGGSSRNQRVGDKVKSRNIRIQLIFNMAPLSSASGQAAIRLLVLRCKYSQPTTSDMPTWYGPVDEDKFFVIKDIMIGVASTFYTGSTGGGGESKRVKLNISTGLRKLQYDGPSSMSPLNNETVVYMLTSNNTAQVAYNWKHYYIDT